MTTRSTDVLHTVVARSRDLARLPPPSTTILPGRGIAGQDATRWSLPTTLAREIAGGGLELRPLHFSAPAAMRQVEVRYLLSSWLALRLGLRVGSLGFSVETYNTGRVSLYYCSIGGEPIWVSEEESLLLHIDVSAYLDLVVLSHSRLAWVVLSTMPQLEAYETRDGLIVAEVEMLGYLDDDGLVGLRQRIEDSISALESNSSVARVSTPTSGVEMELINGWSLTSTPVRGWRRSRSGTPLPLDITLVATESPSTFGGDLQHWISESVVSIYDGSFPSVLLELRWPELRFGTDECLRLTYLACLALHLVAVESNPFLVGLESHLYVGSDGVLHLPAATLEDLENYREVLQSLRGQLSSVAIGDVTSTGGPMTILFDGSGRPTTGESATVKCWWTGPVESLPVEVEVVLQLRPSRLLLDEGGLTVFYDDGGAASLIELRTVSEPPVGARELLERAWWRGSFVSRWGNYQWMVLGYPSVVYARETLRFGTWEDALTEVRRWFQ